MSVLLKALAFFFTCPRTVLTRSEPVDGEAGSGYLFDSLPLNVKIKGKVTPVFH